MSKRPRRISLEGVLEISPSASGATMAGQKKRRNMNAPTAVNLASGKRLMTAEEIYILELACGNTYRVKYILTILQIFLNETGMCAAELQMSSMKTFVTACNWSAFLCNSSAEVVRVGSSSRSRSLAFNIRRSRTCCNVALRYDAPFHFAYTDNIFVATQFLRRSSASFSTKS
jgi:hypothetical protein